MRWLLVSLQHHPDQGGVGTYVSRFCQAAQSAGWDVTLITAMGPSTPAGIHVEIVELEPLSPERITSLRRIERIRPYQYGRWSLAVAERLLELEGPFDCIEFPDVQAQGLVSLSSREIHERWNSTPQVIHAHTPMFVEESFARADCSRFGRNVYHTWERQAIQSADGLIATSRDLLDRLPGHRCSAVIPYPIAASASVSLNSCETPLVLFVGSLQPRKGIDLWATSLNRVLARCPNARAVAIGPDTPTGPDGRSMQQHAVSLLDHAIRERVQFAGSMPHDETLAAIRSASLLVVPSWFESFSFAAAEALLCGCPVLVTDQVGIAQHVAGIPTCIAGCVDDLADRQIEMLTNPSRARTEAIEQRRRMLEACSPLRHLEARVRFLDSLQAASRPRSGDSGVSLGDMREFLEGIESMEQSRVASISTS